MTEPASCARVQRLVGNARPWALLLLGVAAVQGRHAAAAAPEPHEKACSLLTDTAQSAQLAGEAAAPGRYGCKLLQEHDDGWVLALQYVEAARPPGQGRALGRYLVDVDAGTVTPWMGASQASRTLALASAVASVRACGVAFDLPAAYRITRPRRSVTHQGVRVCAFDVVPASATAERLECKDEAEGGSPPYGLCDWEIRSGREWPTVQVARTRVDVDRLPLPPFEFERGAWRLPNAHAPAAPAQKVAFFGRQARHGEAVSRASWYRAKARPSVEIYAGASSTGAYLLQLTPELAVVLVSPPVDPGATDAGGTGQCKVFCRSLRAAARPSEEP